MKTCLCCSKTKLFMKLSNGLCPDCYSEFKNNEKKYKGLLNQITSKTETMEALIKETTLLSIELRKFDSADFSLKSTDCLTLMNMIKDLYNTEKPLPNVTDNTMPPSILNSSNEDSDIFVNNNSKNITTDQHSDIIMSDDNISTNSQNNDDTLTNTTSDILDYNDESNSVEHSKAIQPVDTINSDIYEDIESLVASISNPNLEIDELCYYLFLLKDTYIPILNKYNITEIDEININELININFKKASIALRCDINNLYSFYNYVAFSIQTTGIKIESNDIIEISAIKVRFGQIEDTFHTYVNPIKTISIVVENRTNISNETLINAPTLDIVLKEFINFTDNLALVSHNSHLNYGFIKYNCNKLFDKEIFYNTECTMKLYRTRYKSFYGEPPKKFSLEYCCEDLLDSSDITLKNSNTSQDLASALNTYKIYEILKKRYK